MLSYPPLLSYSTVMIAHYTNIFFFFLLLPLEWEPHGEAILFHVMYSQYVAWGLARGSCFLHFGDHLISIHKKPPHVFMTVKCSIV